MIIFQATGNLRSLSLLPASHFWAFNTHTHTRGASLPRQLYVRSRPRAVMKPSCQPRLPLNSPVVRANKKKKKKQQDGCSLNGIGQFLPHSSQRRCACSVFQRLAGAVRPLKPSCSAFVLKTLPLGLKNEREIKIAPLKFSERQKKKKKSCSQKLPVRLLSPEYQSLH